MLNIYGVLLGRVCLLTCKRHLSELFIALTVWLTFFVTAIQCHFAVHITTLLLVLAFKAKTLLGFYVIFEATVVPIVLVIFIYGYQPEKIQASFYLIIYTVVRRMPLLIYILTDSSLSCLAATLAFMVKTPLFIFHAWLPKAHVEAPVAGSIILAGVLLKLGTYGLFLILPQYAMRPILSFYLALSLLGGVVCSLLCLRDGDIKTLIAHSSVVHMGVVNLGLLRGSEVGYCGAVMISIGHGLCSPFLFAFSYHLYCSSHSRLLCNNIIAWPSLIRILGVLVSINMRLPPRLGLWSELLITIGIYGIGSIAIPFILLMIFLRACYNLYIYTSCAHAKKSSYIKEIISLPIVQVCVLCYRSLLYLDFLHISFLPKS